MNNMLIDYTITITRVFYCEIFLHCHSTKEKGFTLSASIKYPISSIKLWMTQYQVLVMMSAKGRSLVFLDEFSSVLRFTKGVTQRKIIEGYPQKDYTKESPQRHSTKGSRAQKEVMGDAIASTSPTTSYLP